MGSMKELAAKGVEAQIKADIEAAELEAWEPPTETWIEMWHRSEAVRSNYIARINAFQTDNLRAWWDETYH
jgi:hypothetical protein